MSSITCSANITATGINWSLVGIEVSGTPLVIGGAVGGSTTTTLTINYSSTTPTDLFLSIITEEDVVSVKDSNGTNWSIAPSGAGSNPALAYILASPAITSVTITTGAGTVAISAVLQEYIGITSVIGATTSSSGTTSPMTLTKTITPGDWLIVGGGAFPTDSPTITANTGNLRDVGTIIFDSHDSEYYAAVLVDNFLPFYPTVTTEPATSVTSINAVLNGDVTSLGGAPDVTVEGFIYSTVSFTTPANGTTPGAGGQSVISHTGVFSTGTFADAVFGLTPNTEYYFSAFAENSTGYSYGNVETFTTGVVPVGTVLSINFGFGFGGGS